MATKKQKREAALAKREELMAKVKSDGLKAQADDKERQIAQAYSIREEAAAVNARYQRILDEATPEDWEAARRRIGN